MRWRTSENGALPAVVERIFSVLIVALILKLLLYRLISSLDYIESGLVRGLHHRQQLLTLVLLLFDACLTWNVPRLAKLELLRVPLRLRLTLILDSCCESKRFRLQELSGSNLQLPLLILFVYLRAVVLYQLGL